MSLRAEILRLGLRWFCRRGADPEPDIPHIRRKLHTLKRFIPGPARKTVRTPVNANGVTGLRVATPQSEPGRLVFYLHGGAYCFGSPAHYRDFLWRVAAAARAEVVCIDYRLAPEHRFPAAIDDSVQAYRGLIRNGTDPRRMAIMGDSAGGGLAFATLLRLRDEGVPLPAAAVGLSPWTDLAATGASIVSNEGNDPMLDAAQSRFFAKTYLGGADARHPYASPLYGDPTGLPPALIQVGSDEILLDDSVRLAHKLRAAGCPVELQVWPRMPHVWQLYARILPEARKALAEAGEFVLRMTPPVPLALPRSNLTLQSHDLH
jgi:acetyl esterase/lipase